MICPEVLEVNLTNIARISLTVRIQSVIVVAAARESNGK
ncbi:MAG: hypothetical protein AW12_01873 [Candidatus Accumulibacter sp. BA-94]|nr:MAG: hypothetical protein AW12_01873 [Candidatus Accumulibacter sp. BA-94]